jgi:uncharacterized protein (TIGR02996 family)
MLQALHAALVAGSWSAALEHALVAWRATRAPTLADLVDAIDARIPVIEPPEPAALHAWWMARAFAGKAADLRGLLATFEQPGAKPSPYDRDFAVTDAEACRRRWRDRPASPLAPMFENYWVGWRYERVAALLGWERDPRVARALVTVLAGSDRLSATDDRRTVIADAIGDRLGEIADGRLREQLDAYVASPPAASARVRAGQVACASRAITGLDRAPRPTAPGPLLEDCAALVTPPAPIARAPARPHARTGLWTEIAAHPGDLAMRLVLGDALVQAGDPRGDVILLQCGGPPGRPRRAPRTADHDGRVRTLIRRNWSRWLGELAPAVSWRQSPMRNGMLAEIALGNPNTPRTAYAAARDHRELGCVEAVHSIWVLPEDFATFVGALPNAPHTLTIHAPASLDLVAAQRPLALRTLHCRIGPGNSHPNLFPPPRRRPFPVTWGARAGEPLLATFERFARLAPQLAVVGFDLLGNLGGIGDELLALVPWLARSLPAFDHVVVSATTVAFAPKLAALPGVRISSPRSRASAPRALPRRR